MSRKNDITFKINDLGAISDAELNLNNLTTIIGPNSSSKTYLNYLVYSFLSHLLQDECYMLFSLLGNSENSSGNSLLDFYLAGMDQNNILKSLKKRIVDEIDRKNEVIHLDFEDISINMEQMINDLASFHSTALVYNIGLGTDKMPLFNITVNNRESIFGFEFQGEEYGITFIKSKNTNQIDLIYKKDYIANSSAALIEKVIVPELMTRIFQNYFRQIFPNPIVITSERTGVSFFYNKLKDFIDTRQRFESVDNKIVYKVKNSQYKDIGDGLYQQPVLDNITLFYNLINSKEESFLVKNNENVIVEYIQKEINHGSYIVEGGDGVLSEKKLVFKIENDSSIEINAASSSIKSLSLLDLYIRKKAKLGDLLIIDEPELNLHPSNQRKIARLLVMLANKGIKVMFTTHSDYLMGEINTLIQAKALKEDSQSEIIEEFGLDKNMLLNKKDISAYFLNKNGSGQFDLKEVPERNGALVLDSFDDEIRKFAEFSRMVQELAYEESF